MSSTSVLSLIPLFLILLSALPAEATRPHAVDISPFVPGPDARIANDDRLRPTLESSAVAQDSGLDRHVQKVIGKSAPTAGGSDVYFADPTDRVYSSQVAIASDGDVFVALLKDTASGTDSYIELWWSTDGGDEFLEVWSFGEGDGLGQSLQDLEIAEGSANRLFLVFKDADWIKVARFEVAPTVYIPTIDNVYFGGVTSDVDIASDAASFAGYYLYMTFVGDDGNGDDIWFMRSINQGNSWEAAYKIAELTTSGYLVYRTPRVVYGYGGYVHVAWNYMENIQQTFDDAIRYRRATSYADGGITAWDPGPIDITPIDDGLNQRMSDIAASRIDGDVLIAHQYQNNEPEIIVRRSSDSGATWPAVEEVNSGLELDGELIYRDATDEFILAATAFSDFNPTAWHDRVFKLSPGSDPLNFGASNILSDGSDMAFISSGAEIALNPAQGDRVALAWNHAKSGTLTAGFDAEWRGDTGYPNTEWIFDTDPSTTSGRPSPPAAVNLNADPYDEIVFGDIDGRVHVLSHLGVELNGWPIEVGGIPANSAVAVGDLNGDGEMAIVVGNSVGVVHAFHPDGSELDGFPVDLGTGTSSFVSIGALGGPYPRSIVVTSGQTMQVLNFHGEKINVSNWLFTDTFTSAAAIGDLENDGVADIVTAKGSYVHVHHVNSGLNQMFRFLSGKTLTNSPSLGDLDNNGDLEIVIPTANGDVYALEHDGSDHAGSWPYSNPAGGAVNAVALSDMLGPSDVEMAFTQVLSTFNVLWGDGVQGLNYPFYTTPSYELLSGPAIERVSASSPSVIVATHEGALYAVRNLGSIPASYPKNLGDRAEVTPVVRDIDLDGDLEIVTVTNSIVVSMDINQAPHPLAGSKWPMAGYDPQRTSCLNCAEDLMTAVDPGIKATRISFAPASPNPTSGSLVFHYKLPQQAQVEMEVFDARGRRVRTVARLEQGAGEHQLGFDGRDQRGQQLASGQYFGRLRVRGPNQNEEITRKFIVIR